jgi:Ca2+-binding EF-hand superfamily protein
MMTSRFAKVRNVLVAATLSVAGVVGVAVACEGKGERKKEMVEKFDANKDGQLDDTERAKMKAEFEARHAERKAEMLARYDANKDGKLDDTEKARMKADRQAERKARLGERFKALDTDRSGQLSKLEVKDSPMAERFAEIDADKNGSLSLAELEAAAPRHRHGRGGPRFDK